jgi:hypothetical protein
MKKLYFIITILVVIIISLMVTTFNMKVRFENQMRDYKEQQTSWTQDSLRLRTEINDKNQQLVSTKVMRLELADLKTLYAGQSRALTMLQKTVGKHTDNAIYYATTKRDTIYMPVDSIWFGIDSTALPVYQGKVSDEWGTHEITATPDSMFLTYEVYDEFQFTENWETENKSKLIPRFLKKKELVLNVVNLNPNTRTRGAGSWRAPSPRKKTFTAFGIGVGVGIGTTIYLMSR